MGELAAAADFIREWDHIEWIKLRLEMLRALKKSKQVIDLNACD